MTTLTLSTSKPATTSRSTPSSSASPRAPDGVVLAARRARTSTRRSTAGSPRPLAALGATGAGRRGHQAAHARRDHRAGGRRGRRWARPSSRPQGAPRTTARCCAAPPARRPRAGRHAARSALALPGRRRREDAAAVAEGALLGAYAFTRATASTSQPSHKAAGRVVHACVSRAGRDKAVKAAVARARGRRPRPSHLARDLVNTPPARPAPGRASPPWPSPRPRRGRAQGRGARREGAAQGRVRRHPRRRAGLVATRRGWCKLTYTAARKASGTSRSSARASRSTPAACRSSRPRRWRG